MTQLLTTRSGGGTITTNNNIIEQTSYPKLDYNRAFSLNTKQETIGYTSSTGDNQTTPINVLTIPCDGVLKIVYGNDTSSTRLYKYYTKNWTSGSAGGNAPRINGMEENSIPVSKGDKFISSVESPNANQSFFTIIPYVNVDIEYNGHVNIKFLEQNDERSKKVSDIIPENYALSDFTQDDIFDLPPALSGYRPTGGETMCDADIPMIPIWNNNRTITKYKFKGWTSNKSQQDAMSNGELYDGQKINSRTLYAVYEVTKLSGITKDQTFDQAKSELSAASSLSTSIYVAV